MYLLHIGLRWNNFSCGIPRLWFREQAGLIVAVAEDVSHSKNANFVREKWSKKRAIAFLTQFSCFAFFLLQSFFRQLYGTLKKPSA